MVMKSVVLTIPLRYGALIFSLGMDTLSYLRLRKIETVRRLWPLVIY